MSVANFTPEQRKQCEQAGADLAAAIRQTAEAPLAGFRQVLRQAKRTAAAVREFLAKLPTEGREGDFPANIEPDPEATAHTAHRPRGPPRKRKKAASGRSGSLSQMVRRAAKTGKSNSRSSQKNQPPLALYSGQTLCGYLRGAEGLDACGKSLGNFRTRSEAVSAVLGAVRREVAP